MLFFGSFLKEKFGVFVRWKGIRYWIMKVIFVTVNFIVFIFCFAFDDYVVSWLRRLFFLLLVVIYMIMEYIGKEWGKKFEYGKLVGLIKIVLWECF